MNILIIADVVARPGRLAVLDKIQSLREEYKIDIALMNGENVAGGFSITPALADEPDAWDGGHRVPCVVRWPGVIKPARVSDEIICHNSLMATCAEILGAKLPDDAGVDSFSILPVLRGEETEEPTHPFVIHHSISGRFAIRKGDWKFIAAKGSGGWSKGGDGRASQLYNMADDRKESDNLVDDKPEVVAAMEKMLNDAVAAGRTTPGPEQKNDAEVIVWKDGKETMRQNTKK